MAVAELPIVTTTGMKLKAKCLNPECKKPLGQPRLEPRDTPPNYNEELPTGFYVVPNGIICPHCGAWNYFTVFGSFQVKE